MAYKHILIAVDLSPESKVLVEKAVSMARPYNAKVSLIHVDVNYSAFVQLDSLRFEKARSTHYVAIIRISGAS